MARQKRSTSAILKRLASIIGILALVHVTARLLHMWGVMAERELVEGSDYWDPTYVPISFWDTGVDHFYMEWYGLVMVYVFAAISIALVWGIFKALKAAYEWLFFEPEKDLGCRDGRCPCIEHRGMVFYEDGRYWDYPPDSSANLAVGIATGVAVGIAVGS